MLRNIENMLKFWKTEEKPRFYVKNDKILTVL